MTDVDEIEDAALDALDALDEDETPDPLRDALTTSQALGKFEAWLGREHLKFGKRAKAKAAKLGLDGNEAFRVHAKVLGIVGEVARVTVGRTAVNH